MAEGQGLESKSKGNLGLASGWAGQACDGPRNSGENFERSSIGPPSREFSAATLGLKNLEFGRKVTRESNPSRNGGGAVWSTI